MDHQRHAFTIIDLLITISIISLLILLSIPAVQAAREASRRTACQNKLKQLGVSLHMFHDANGSLPYATPFDNVTNDSAGNRWDDLGPTWCAAILPYLEEHAVYGAFDFKKPMNDPSNAAAVQMKVAIFICPSDKVPKGGIFHERPTRAEINPENVLGLWYPASMGPTDNDRCSTFCPTGNPSFCCQGYSYGSNDKFGNPSPSFVGMFGRFAKGVRFGEVLDGLSHTFMVGESIPDQCVYLCAYCLNFPIAGTTIPPNVFDGSTRGDNYWRACGFKSRHPGGTNFVMGDGSVHYFRDDIDYNLYNALGTRAGHEQVTIP